MVISSDKQGAALAASADHRSGRGWKVLSDFAALLRLPNVTGHSEDLRANAEELVRRFGERGATMEMVEFPDASPVVIGELRTSSPTATLGVYVHYDGQPVDPTEWTTPPFAAVLASNTWHAGGETLELPEPSATIEPEWRIYARGASDDKAPFVALTAAIDALAEAPIDRTVDLVFLFDGEEESGSPNLGRYMTDLLPRLGADAWLLCDGPVHQTRVAQVGFGARGHTSFNLTFYGPERELHSGHYGNWVPNPVLDLATFLAGCKDDLGMVTIEGFYDDTLPLSEADQAAIAGLPQIENQLMEDLGFGGPEVETGRYEERLMIPSHCFNSKTSWAPPQQFSRSPITTTISTPLTRTSGSATSGTGSTCGQHCSRPTSAQSDRATAPESESASARSPPVPVGSIPTQ